MKRGTIIWFEGLLGLGSANNSRIFSTNMPLMDREGQGTCPGRSYCVQIVKWPNQSEFRLIFPWGSAAGMGEAWVCSTCNVESLAGPDLQGYPETYLCLTRSIWCGSVMAWATRRRSLWWQTPPLTSHSSKHMPGVTSWICSSEAEKHNWRWGRGICLYPFQHVRSMKKTHEPGVAKCPLAWLCTYKASGRSRAWWKLPGRTGPRVHQMGTPQFLSSVERMDFRADQRASFCFLWNQLNSSHRTQLKEDTKHCWHSPCTEGYQEKGHFSLSYLHLAGLLRGGCEKGTRKKCHREKQDPIMLGAVQVWRRHSHYLKSTDNKTLIAYPRIPHQ